PSTLVEARRRAGTRMPGFSPTGISHTFSSTSTRRNGDRSEIDDKARATGIGGDLQLELVQSNRLQVGALNRGLVDGIALEATGKPVGSVPLNLHVGAGIQLAIAILAE